MNNSSLDTKETEDDYVVAMDYTIPSVDAEVTESDGFYIGQEVDRIFNSTVHVQAGFIANRHPRHVGKVIHTQDGHHDDLWVNYGMSLGEIAMLVTIRRDARKTLKIQRYVRDKELAEKKVWCRDTGGEEEGEEEGKKKKKRRSNDSLRNVVEVDEEEEEEDDDDDEYMA